MVEPPSSDVTHVTKPLLSVVICTWNRSARLQATLRSLLATDSATLSRVQLLVVDNASTDDTAQVVAQFVGAGVEYAFEKRAGLSHARNLGVQLSAAPYVLFLDDDVEVNTDFFARYIDHTTSLVQSGFFGGPIIPAFDGPPRRWTPHVLKSHWWIYSCLDFGGPTRPFTPVQSPFGANFCVKRDLLLTHPFSPERGYRHGVLIPGEETALIAALQDEGIGGWWLADCPVRHCLPAERNSPRYLLRRAFGEGQSTGGSLRISGGSVRWAYKALAVETIGLAWVCLTAPAKAMSKLIEISMLTGVIRS